MKLRYSAEAEAEFEDALGWYAERSANAVRKLEKEVAAAASVLVQHPRFGTPKQDGVRLLPLHDFPYSLVYTIRHEEIVVIALAHHSRRPGYWMGRLGEIR